MAGSAPKPYSIGQLIQAVQKHFNVLNKERVASLWFEGEVADCSTYPSGHSYITLKDAEAQVHTVLFKWDLGGCAAAFRAKMLNPASVIGDKVQVRGLLAMNAKRGDFQFQIKELRLSGAGELYAKYLALKEQFRKEGLFEPSRKRRLPFLPHRIGIVTSPLGSVIHDMCKVLTRRFPNVHVRLYGAKVQGEGAAAEIVKGIEYFNAATDFAADILIVGRGGGSIEDLWAFNEEVVVRAIAASRIPVVSAVGHQDDYTLADFAADLRAGTPSMAAELVVPRKDELEIRLKDLSERLARAPYAKVEAYAQQIDHLHARLAMAPRARLVAARAQLGTLSARLAPLPRVKTAEARAHVALLAARLNPVVRQRVQMAGTRLETLAARLPPAMREGLATVRHRLDTAREKLRLLSPYNVLGRGYSITLNATGEIVHAPDQVSPGDMLVTRLAEGDIRSTVR